MLSAPLLLIFHTRRSLALLLPYPSAVSHTHTVTVRHIHRAPETMWKNFSLFAFSLAHICLSEIYMRSIFIYRWRSSHCFISELNLSNYRMNSKWHASFSVTFHPHPSTYTLTHANTDTHTHAHIECACTHTGLLLHNWLKLPIGETWKFDKFR